MPGSARWLTPRAVNHVAPSGLCLGGEQEYMRLDPDPARPGLDTCRHRTPAWALIKARVCSVLEPGDPIVGGPDLIQGGPDPFQRSGLHTWRSWTKLGGSDHIYRGPAPSHGGPNTWWHRTRPCGGVRCCCWPRVVARGWGESWPGPIYSSFTTRLKIATWVLRLYTVLKGTLVSGYRQYGCCRRD
jgi:hypothetical protein